MFMGPKTLGIFEAMRGTLGRCPTANSAKIGLAVLTALARTQLLPEMNHVRPVSAAPSDREKFGPFVSAFS